MRRICASFPARLCVSGRSRSASGLSHRMVVPHRQSDGCRRRAPMARSGRCSGRRWRRARNRRVGPTSRSGWATPPSPAPIPTDSRNLHAAALARPASKQARFAPGSMHGRCAGSMECRTRRSRRSNSTRQARISATRCVSMPIGRWCCKAMPATAEKSERGQASYYFSQPYFKAAGSITIDDKPVAGHGTGLDGPRVEQPAARFRPDRMGLVLAAS